MQETLKISPRNGNAPTLSEIERVLVGRMPGTEFCDHGKQCKRLMRVQGATVAQLTEHGGSVWMAATSQVSRLARECFDEKYNVDRI